MRSVLEARRAPSSAPSPQLARKNCLQMLGPYRPFGAAYALIWNPDGRARTVGRPAGDCTSGPCGAFRSFGSNDKSALQMPPLVVSFTSVALWNVWENECADQQVLAASARARLLPRSDFCGSQLVNERGGADRPSAAAGPTRFWSASCAW
jgi:hypothetical protein